MKRWLLAALSLASVTASALEHSAYSCIYRREPGGEWTTVTRGWSLYTTDLGWNESVRNWKQLMSGKRISDDLGLCATVSSAEPENVQLNIYFVDGQDLVMEDDGCMFGGSMVRYTVHHQALTSNDQYTYATHMANIAGKKWEILFVLGARPSSGPDPRFECAKALAEIKAAR